MDVCFEDITLRVAKGATEGRVVERAQKISDLRFLVRRWHLRDRDVRTVDLIGHGSPGRFKLGDELLFEGDTGLECIDALRPFLSPRAALRLLGCDVAGATRVENGRALLSKLTARLGAARRAWAPTRPLFPHDYGAEGLLPSAKRVLVGGTTRGRHHGGRT